MIHWIDDEVIYRGERSQLGADLREKITCAFCSMEFPSFLSFCFWDRFSPCFPGWLWTQGPHLPSASQAVGLYPCIPCWMIDRILGRGELDPERLKTWTQTLQVEPGLWSGESGPSAFNPSVCPYSKGYNKAKHLKGSQQMGVRWEATRCEAVKEPFGLLAREEWRVALWGRDLGNLDQVSILISPRQNSVCPENIFLLTHITYANEIYFAIWVSLKCWTFP